MNIKEIIQRKLHMGLFRYLGKFEELFEQEIYCDNIYANCIYLKEHFPDKWKGILESMGVKEDTPIFSVNHIVNGKLYDVVTLCPPIGSNFYGDYFYNKDCIYIRKIKRADYKNDKEFCKELDFAYQDLQNLFTFLKLFEKQMKEMNKLIEIQSDENKEIKPS